MSEHHDNHGNTPAAWTASVLGLVGVFVASIALMLSSFTWFWIGMAILPVALIAGYVMSKAAADPAAGQGKP